MNEVLYILHVSLSLIIRTRIFYSRLKIPKNGKEYQILKRDKIFRNCLCGLAYKLMELSYFLPHFPKKAWWPFCPLRQPNNYSGFKVRTDTTVNITSAFLYETTMWKSSLFLFSIIPSWDRC